MDDLDALARLAYETYCHSKYQRASEILTWEQQPEFWRQNWRDVAKAVAERVLELQRVSVEASE